MYVSARIEGKGVMWQSCFVLDGGSICIVAWRTRDSTDACDSPIVFIVKTRESVITFFYSFSIKELFHISMQRDSKTNPPRTQKVSTIRMES